MSEHTADNGNGGTRLSAHERLSTGALAGWARACATHPWRVLGSWLGIVVVLIALVATVGGSLRDEFEIPGSDTQRATDLIESQFQSEQGSVLNIVLAAPEGQRLDTPERKAAIQRFRAVTGFAGVRNQVQRPPSAIACSGCSILPDAISICVPDVVAIFAASILVYMPPRDNSDSAAPAMPSISGRRPGWARPHGASGAPMVRCGLRGRRRCAPATPSTCRSPRPTARSGCWK